MPERTLPKALADHVDSGITVLFEMLELGFAATAENEATTLRIHNDVGTFTWNEETWTGVGDLGVVSAIAEDGELQPSRIEVALNGLDADLVQGAIDERHIGQPATIYIAARNIMTGAILDAVPIAIGIADTMSATIAEGQAALQLTIEDERTLFGRTAGQLLSNAQQQLRQQGDLFFRFANRQISFDVRWGPQGQNAQGRDTYRQPPSLRRGYQQ